MLTIRNLPPIQGGSSGGDGFPGVETHGLSPGVPSGQIGEGGVPGVESRLKHRGRLVSFGRDAIILCEILELRFGA
jgi:hypothetical protein